MFGRKTVLGAKTEVKDNMHKGQNAQEFDPDLRYPIDTCVERVWQQCTVYLFLAGIQVNMLIQKKSLKLYLFIDIVGLTRNGLVNDAL